MFSQLWQYYYRNFVRPMYYTRFSYLKVATLRKKRKEKAAKSESNEGRYFRNFTVGLEVHKIVA